MTHNTLPEFAILNRNSLNLGPIKTKNTVVLIEVCSYLEINWFFYSNKKVIRNLYCLFIREGGNLTSCSWFWPATSEWFLVFFCQLCSNRLNDSLSYNKDHVETGSIYSSNFYHGNEENPWGKTILSPCKKGPPCNETMRDPTNDSTTPSIKKKEN